MESKEQAIFSLIYCSVATRAMSADDMRSILVPSRRRNSALGISGMLVYYDRCREFVQMLEGEESKVRELFAHIACDPRHRSVDIVHTGTSPCRTFGEWAMGYFAADRSELSSVEGFSDLDEEGLTKVLSGRDGSLARRLLRSLHRQITR